MIDLSEVSYREILDCIVDASLGRLSPYFQEYISMTKNSTQRMISRSTQKILRRTAVFLFTGILLVSICILFWRRATAVPASLGICHTV